jgi:DNA uptake protein ComE-like DNA-binding protein
VLGLLRKQAAALIFYRDKNKGFKSIDDVTKIPAVRFKKIEQAKDRLLFGIVPKKIE